MRLKDLEIELQPLKGFASPKRELEQYVTTAHLAARMLFTAESSYGDIDGKRVLDLGCGCAILSIAAVMMGAESVTSIDVDRDAIAIAQENVASMEMEDFITIRNEEIPLDSSSTADGKKSDRLDPSIPLFNVDSDTKYDTVVMNPPFGSWRKGIDMAFLSVACSVSSGAVYSLHKRSTRDFIKRKATSLGFDGQVLAEMRYDLPNTMKHHKDSSRDIEVDFWRFARPS